MLAVRKERAIDIDVSHRQGRVPVTVLHVKGSIDNDSHADLQTQCRQAMEAGARHLLLDLTDVPHVSSAGLRVFLNILNSMRSGSSFASRKISLAKRSDADAFKSPHVKLLNPSEQVLRVLTMTGLSVFFEIYTDLEEAVASF